MEHAFYVLVDLAGTFAFAVSGAVAAREKRLDLFGLYAMAYLTACGGGIVRDLCLGAVPPVGLSDWRYLACAAVAATLTIVAHGPLERMKHPVTFFDSLGLGFFAVVGAQKALVHGASVGASVMLGTVTAIGGGVMRDVLLGRVPVILEKEIYAVAAIVAASIQVVAELNDWPVGFTPWLGVGVCLVIRLLALRYSWRLPVIGGK